MLYTNPDDGLPAIPSKRYFTISEVSTLCGVKSHVLRYWEQEFPQLNPVKRRGNRRYYQHRDLLLIRRIRVLLYREGYTVSGARQQMENSSKEKTDSNNLQKLVPQIVAELEGVLSLLKA